MDWRLIKFDWNRARAFLATAEEGSLSAAGKALGIAQPTVGRQVAALEKELNVMLFDRVGKHLILTKGGIELVDHVRQMFEAAARISLAASGQSGELEVEVRISATDTIAALCLPAIIHKLRIKYPKIMVEIIASNELSNLARREADIAVRNVQPSHPDLIAKKVCDVGARLYGASTYLNKLGRPLTPENLCEADIAGFNRNQEMVDALRGFGLSTVPSNISVVSENHLVQWEMVRQGFCLGIMMECVGDNESLVERVFVDLEAVKFPIWLVAHQQLRSSKRIRAVFDILAQSLAALS
jgi:DNA-binding transcriptional LysR family regulator